MSEQSVDIYGWKAQVAMWWFLQVWSWRLLFQRSGNRHVSVKITDVKPQEKE